MRNKIYLLLILVIYLPLSCNTAGNHKENKAGRITTGLENFLDNYAGKYKNKKAAFVTNHSGIDFNLQNNINLLREKKIEIALILAPEHGFYGYQNEYDDKIYTEDNNVNAIIYNLHFLNSSKIRHLLKVADFVIFDIQDMGLRCYTYISSLKLVMDSLSGTDMEFIVLDRPNPLGFLNINGPFLEEGFFSKNISSFPVPLLYNMTIGEAAGYYNTEFQKKVNLNIIPMKGYYRDMRYDETMLPWIPPSPNLPNYECSIVYSAIVLLEGINISVGRGTTKPFEYIGAPWIEPVSFSRGMSGLNLKNFMFRPVYFEPTFSKYKGIKCGGVQIIYTGGKFDPVEISFKLISYIMKNYSEFQWETYKSSHNIDYLAGTDKLRKAIIDEKKFSEFRAEIWNDVASFSKKRKKYLIYLNDNFPL